MSNTRPNQPCPNPVYCFNPVAIPASKSTNSSAKDSTSVRVSVTDTIAARSSTLLTRLSAAVTALDSVDSAEARIPERSTPAALAAEVTSAIVLFSVVSTVVRVASGFVDSMSARSPSTVLLRELRVLTTVGRTVVRVSVTSTWRRAMGRVGSVVGRSVGRRLVRGL